MANPLSRLPGAGDSGSPWAKGPDPRTAAAPKPADEKAEKVASEVLKSGPGGTPDGGKSPWAPETK